MSEISRRVGRFGASIPTAAGVLSFSTLEEAVDAIEHVSAEPERHARTARDLAAAYFDSDKVLTRLIDRAMCTHEPRPPRRQQ